MNRLETLLENTKQAVKHPLTLMTAGMMLLASCKDNPGKPELGDVRASVTAPSQVETHQEASYGASCSAEDGLTDVTFIYDGEMSNSSVNSTRWDTSFVDTPTRAGEKNIEVICEDVNEQTDSAQQTTSVLQHETDFSLVADMLEQYKTGEISLSITDPDTLTTVTVTENSPDGVNEFTVAPNAVDWDTTFSREYQTPGDVTFSVDVDTRNETREDIAFSKNFDIAETPYVMDATLEFRNLFTKEGMDGYVTFPGFRTLRVENGVAQIGLEDKIDSDSLFTEKYRIHFEPDNSYVNHSSIIRSENGDLVPIDVLPEEYRSADGSEEWDYETHKQHLWRQGIVADPDPDNRLSRRWPDNADITVLLYDESYSGPCSDLGYDNNDRCAIPSDDENLLGSPDFFEHSKRVYTELGDMIPTLSVDVKVQSESEEEFPVNINELNANKQKYIINVIGSPDAPFPFTAGTNKENGWVYSAGMAQRTDPPYAEGNNGLIFAVMQDGIESLGQANTNINTNDMTSPRLEWTSMVKPFLYAIHTRPANTGYAKLGVGVHEDTPALPNKNGTYTTEVYDWVATDTTAPFEN